MSGSCVSVYMTIDHDFTDTFELQCPSNPVAVVVVVVACLLWYESWQLGDGGLGAPGWSLVIRRCNSSGRKK